METNAKGRPSALSHTDWKSVEKGNERERRKEGEIGGVGTAKFCKEEWRVRTRGQLYQAIRPQDALRTKARQGWAVD